MFSQHVSHADWLEVFHHLDPKISQGVDDKIKAFLTASEYAQFVDYSEDFSQWETINEVVRILQFTECTAHG